MWSALSIHRALTGTVTERGEERLDACVFIFQTAGGELAVLPFKCGLRGLGGLRL